jgi:hypothetical protein
MRGQPRQPMIPETPPSEVNCAAWPLTELSPVTIPDPAIVGTQIPICNHHFLNKYPLNCFCLNPLKKYKLPYPKDKEAIQDGASI